MPFTPFHLGFGLLLFALCPYLDVFAILIGTVIIDLEPIFYLLFGVGALHGYMHSLLGVIVFLLPSTFLSWSFYKILEKVLPKKFLFNWPLSLLSSFIGLVSHILFDAGLYSEMMLLYPFSQKTGILFGYWTHLITIITLSAMFLLGLVILFVKYVLKYKYNKELLLSYNLSQKVTEEALVE